MILFDFHCSACDVKFESLVRSDQTEETCPTCEGTATRVLSAARVGLYNDPAARREALMKRSYDHSMKEAKKNAEQIASKMGAVAKPQAKWNLRSHKKSSS